jgi:SNF2 family DNA or RNA helicase
MSFKGSLLPYQEEAVEMMCSRGKVLVAYDLGLGKTVLTIAAIESMRDSGKIKGPGLIICLSSLKYQWQSQIEKFTEGTAKTIVIEGTPKQRLDQYKAIASKKIDVDYVIFNYEQVVNDKDYVNQLPMNFIVCDEATALKSFKSKRSKIIKKLKSPIKFALTGTPVENGKAEELFSIMQFVDDKVLGSYPSFEAKYIVRNSMGWIEKYKNIDMLSTQLKTASVRKRQKDKDVAPYLPKTLMASPILVPFDSAGKALYSSIVDELLVDLEDAARYMSMGINLFGDYKPDNGPIDEVRGVIMSKLTALRLLCDHPLLLRASGKAYSSSTFGEEGSRYAAELLEQGRLDRAVKSPKLDVLKETVKNFLEEDKNNKLVIFSGFVAMVGIIAADLDAFGVQKYTGKMNAKEKEIAKIDFQTNPSTRILVSSDAGGYGVDLPQANLLVNYDLPWNAGLALQRNGRIQRASSTWEKVVVQDLMMLGSIEERQHAMLQQKMSVASAIVDGEGITEQGGLNLNLGTLRGFLQSI